PAARRLRSLRRPACVPATHRAVPGGASLRELLPALHEVTPQEAGRRQGEPEVRHRPDTAPAAPGLRRSRSRSSGSAPRLLRGPGPGAAARTTGFAPGCALEACLDPGLRPAISRRRSGRADRRRGRTSPAAGDRPTARGAPLSPDGEGTGAALVADASGRL